MMQPGLGMEEARKIRPMILSKISVKGGCRGVQKMSEGQMLEIQPVGGAKSRPADMRPWWDVES